jgi:arylsulfatase A-like enzyme
MFGKLHLTPQQYTYQILKSRHSIVDASPFLEDAGLPPMPDDPFKQRFGFQDVVGHEDGLWGEYTEWVAERDSDLAAILPDWGMGPWEGWKRIEPQAENSLKSVGPTMTPPELHPSWFVGETAADYFTAHHNEGPCFLHVSFVDPHPPFNPPAEIAAEYDPDQMPMPDYSDTGDLEWPESLRERWYRFDGVTPELARTAIAYYYATIDMIDRAVGELVDAVEAAGEMKNTLFVFIADHGEFLGSYGLWMKGSFHYDCLIRVPCFVSWQGKLPAGQRVDGLSESIDIMPTVLDLAGLPIGPQIQGRDLSAGLRGEEAIGRPWAFTESYLALWGPFVNCFTVETDMAKLNYYPTDHLGHLFDLEQDPDERHNVFEDPGRRGLRDEMMATLVECLHGQRDPLPRITTQY